MPGRRAAAASVLAGIAMLLDAGAAWALPGVPEDAFLLSLARSGKIVLAVGDDGAILRSADDGAHWSVVAAPTRAALTRVIMQPGGADYAVGFDATILRSDDDGLRWTRQFSDDRADNPLFGVVSLPGGAALAVGGFGHAYASAANGAPWRKQPILAADDDFHLNDVLRVESGRLLLVGEAALLMVSENAGVSWQHINVPVQGSLFGAVAASPQSWLAFGLRGHLLATGDAGAHWRIIESGTTAELLGGTRLQDGRVVIVGNRGTAVLVDRDMQEARLLPTGSRANFADCVQTQSGTVLAAGDGGLTVLAVPPVAARH
jgi:photosystem II stability/assembly factor-like uncharacterized protein